MTHRPLTLAALLLASPVAAQPSAPQTAKVTALWQIAFDEWSPLFTCGATMPASDEVIRNAWSKTRKTALDAMAEAGWPAEDLAKWAAKSEPDTLRLPLETPFAKVIAYCATKEDWSMRAARIDVLPIGAEVAKILKPAASP